MIIDHHWCEESSGIRPLPRWSSDNLTAGALIEKVSCSTSYDDDDDDDDVVVDDDDDDDDDTAPLHQFNDEVVQYYGGNVLTLLLLIWELYHIYVKAYDSHPHYMTWHIYVRLQGWTPLCSLSEYWRYSWCYIIIHQFIVVYWFTHSSTHQSIHPSIHQYNHPSIHLSIWYSYIFLPI